MQLSFVLVRPTRPANVGAAARALKTMGFSELVLVGSELHQHEEARWVAHASEEILNSAICVDNLETLRNRFDLIIATTARERSTRRHYYQPEQVNELLLSRRGKAAIVFGCESSGLSNAELQLCDIFSYIPLAQAQPSLNLGQAVMVYAYALCGIHNAIGLSPETAGHSELQFLKKRIKNLLNAHDGIRPEKLDDWLLERVSSASDRDIKMLHQLLGLFDKQ